MQSALHLTELLLVEDDPASVGLMREALKGNDVALHLRVAQDGEQALAMVHCEGIYASVPRPDLILLDLRLPRMDGLSVLTELKSDQDLKCIPVVVLTNSAAAADIRACYAMGANAYMLKPRDFAQTQALVHALNSFWLVSATIFRRELCEDFSEAHRTLE
jgi:CheY-like chemotaxis protein